MSGINMVSDVVWAVCGVPAAHAYVNMQIDDITRYYAKNGTVSKGR